MENRKDPVKRRIYQIWWTMKKRCLDKENKDYIRYGGRGITVYDGWVDNFDSFYKWAITNNYELGLTLDRMDSNGNYEPDNCRWATRKTQARNRSTNVIVEINGVAKTAIEWEEEYGLAVGTVRRRLENGYTGKDLIAPINTLEKKEYIKINGVKLNPSKVIAIDELIKKGLALKDIAKDFNVNPSVISNIKAGRIWSHVTGRKKD